MKIGAKIFLNPIVALVIVFLASGFPAVTGVHAQSAQKAPAEAAKPQNPIPAGKESIERGGKIYSERCAVCHGVKGRGDGPGAAQLKPKPGDLAKAGKNDPAGEIARIIANGRGSMPAWKTTLTESEIWDLTNFIQSLGQR